MKTIKYGEQTLEIFDSIQTLPAHRHSEMQYYLLADLGIGSSFEDINSHLSGIRMAVAQKDDSAIAQEIENLMLGYLSMAGKYNPKYMGWLCLIYKYNGDVITDISEEGLKELGRKISEEGGIEWNWQQVFDVKKKLFPLSWRRIFQPLELEEEDLSMFISDLD